MKSHALAVAMAGLFCGSAPPVSAETVSAHWDSYFYAAPRDSARVLDEVQDKAKLDVQSCENGWCRVRYGAAEGYVRDFVVHGPENEVHPEVESAVAACFMAVQPGGAAWQEERFCRSKP
jgi:mannose/cellobiose epimerase-like protein (N-acyl-D-glucosamine 2-epimerase family)